MFIQISVNMTDEPGELTKFTNLLHENEINIKSITVSQVPGLVLFIVDKPNACIKILQEKDYEFSKKKVVAIPLPDNPTSSQEIEKVAEILGSNKVNIDFLYTTFIKASPMLIIHLDDNEKAKKVLKAEGMYVLEELED
ncbi:MAG: hypothetical protein R6U96_05920 [Promethearchaeia archaeon]